MADLPVHVRPATPADRPRLGEMAGKLVRLHHAFDASRFLALPGVEDGYGRWLLRESSRDHAVVLVAERGDGAIVGYVYATMEDMSWEDLRGPCGYIHDIWVDDEERGHGVATQLLEGVSSLLRQRGAPRLVLMTASQNAIAHALFRKLGFRDTMIEMTRDLPPA